MNVVKHWGEIKDKKTNQYTPDVSTDIEKSMSKFCLAEFDPEGPDTQPDSEHVVLQTMDPLMLHAISLHKHANNMTEMIRVAEIAIESKLIPPEDAALSIPDRPVIERKHTKNCMNFIPKDYTPFTEGVQEEYPELSRSVAKHILTKCVRTLDMKVTTHNSVLLLLADVLEAFLEKISLKFKIASEEEKSDSLGRFPCYPEKVLMEFGMGGMRGLHDYYENRVVKYINVLHNRCEELNDHYEKLLIPKCESPEDKINKMGIKMEDQEEEVVEVQMNYPVIEGEMGFLTMETGFQLLNSLEAETNLGAESEEVTSTSPGVTTETDSSSNLSPFPKIKRMK